MDKLREDSFVAACRLLQHATCSFLQNHFCSLFILQANEFLNRHSFILGPGGLQQPGGLADHMFNFTLATMPNVAVPC